MYLPYGYTYRMTGHGHIDEFGFRINVDLASLINRAPNHKIIATFGGSTTWSIDCLPHETYTAVLEKLLNEGPASKKKGLKFTCLNFGQVAYSVISEMMTYLLYSAEVKPDVVIAHDGWNDLLYGTYIDPYMLKERKIVYPCDLESWAQILHDGASEETTKSTKIPYPLRSSPSQNIDAYFFRKAQFKRIVEAEGGMFIWGLQPCLHDKKNLLEEERLLSHPDNPINQDDWRVVRKKVPRLMRQTAAAFGEQVGHFVDIGAAFANAPKKTRHFTDTIHLTKDGDAYIAKVYKQYFIDKILETF